MFKLEEGGGQLLAAGLKMPRLAAPAKPERVASALASTKAKRIPPPLASDPEDEWTEF
ncbi:MAG: hypothetical protein PHQ05_06640 [Sterolibacterium sp.]|nr:hypothetical protein [Sterolibacterium sp.]